VCLCASHDLFVLSIIRLSRRRVLRESVIRSRIEPRDCRRSRCHARQPGALSLSLSFYLFLCLSRADRIRNSVRAGLVITASIASLYGSLRDPRRVGESIRRLSTRERKLAFAADGRGEACGASVPRAIMEDAIIRNDGLRSSKREIQRVEIPSVAGDDPASSELPAASADPAPLCTAPVPLMQVSNRARLRNARNVRDSRTLLEAPRRGAGRQRRSRSTLSQVATEVDTLFLPPPFPPLPPRVESRRSIPTIDPDDHLGQKRHTLSCIVLFTRSLSFAYLLASYIDFMIQALIAPYRSNRANYARA